MKVLTLAREKPGAPFALADTFDALWHQAEEIGDVSVEKQRIGSPDYRASIHFNRPSGSFIVASGKHNDKHEALKLAILEAMALIGA